ncbi:hypothetical protein [Pseudomonas monteilii]|uniref:hypothetical protein n=1 Tax=Pseudomonas monteilii TaxID=76759 RepID=UPI001E606A16|nr:hypothetical protein [Pseudomonas monteilii]MCE0933431.1 hypothetical protein [Pseudomonas monteilii]MCE0981655.1 hypothetical protein [Pseudomonas monteilii]MDH0023211.1 hypothetical protein [Pseudomonas monteilii]WJN89790.1 hypothetical protein LU680_07690 [Pseudomonas monteilii]WJR40752.1 hypothetical protein LU662_006955 [Pseudomonas monteilii]
MINLTDNLAHRALFTLPPIRPSAESAPAVRALPEQKVVTGDKEVDAVLWLRDVIKTGQAGAVATALEAAKKIKTPLKEVEQRYVDYVKRTSGNNPFAVMFSYGFADLEGLAKGSLEKAALASEARARFEGETIFEDTPAEQFCEKALKRCKGFKSYFENDKTQVAKRFRKHADLMPSTLDDCLYEIAYWGRLYVLRHAAGEWGDGMHEAIAREWFVQGLLSEIKPRDEAEALRVLDYAAQSESIEHDGMVAIARNLIASGGLPA